MQESKVQNVNILSRVLNRQPNPFSLFSDKDLLDDYMLSVLFMDDLQKLSFQYLQEYYLIGLLYLQAFQKSRVEFQERQKLNQIKQLTNAVTTNFDDKQLYNISYFGQIKQLYIICDKLNGMRLSLALSQELFFYMTITLQNIQKKEQAEKIKKEFEYIIQQQQENLTCGSPYLIYQYQQKKDIIDLQRSFEVKFLSGNRDSAINELIQNINYNKVFQIEDISQFLEEIGSQIENVFYTNNQKCMEESQKYIDQPQIKEQVEEVKIEQTIMQSEEKSQSQKTTEQNQNQIQQSNQPDENSKVDQQLADKQEQIVSQEFQHQNQNNLNSTLQQIDQQNQGDQIIQQVGNNNFDEQQNYAISLINLLDIISPFSYSLVSIPKNIIKQFNLEEFIDGIDSGEQYFELGYAIYGSLEACQNKIMYPNFLFQVVEQIMKLIQHIQGSQYFNKLFNSLSRLYELFPERRTKLKRSFSTFFKVVITKKVSFDSYADEIERFFYKIQCIYNDQELFQDLTNLAAEQAIFSSQNLQEQIPAESQPTEANQQQKQPQNQKPAITTFQQLIQKTNKSNLIFSQLIIKNGLPIEKIVPAGKNGIFKRYFEITKIFSIMNYSFAVSKNDISFEIKYMGNFEKPSQEAAVFTNGLSILKLDKIKCDNKAYRANLLALRTGIYVAEFTNVYSWFTEKYLRFRINIFDPIEVNYPYLDAIKGILFPSVSTIPTLCNKLPLVFREKLIKSQYCAALILKKDLFGIIVSNNANINEIWVHNIQINAETVKKDILQKLIEVCHKRFSSNLGDFFVNKYLDFLIVKPSCIDIALLNQQSQFQALIKESIPQIQIYIRDEYQIVLKEFYKTYLTAESKSKTNIPQEVSKQLDQQQQQQQIQQKIEQWKSEKLIQHKNGICDSSRVFLFQFDEYDELVVVEDYKNVYVVKEEVQIQIDYLEQLIGNLSQEFDNFDRKIVYLLLKHINIRKASSYTYQIILINLNLAIQASTNQQEASSNNPTTIQKREEALKTKLNNNFSTIFSEYNKAKYQIDPYSIEFEFLSAKIDIKLDTLII